MLILRFPFGLAGQQLWRVESTLRHPLLKKLTTMPYAYTDIVVDIWIRRADSILRVKNKNMYTKANELWLRIHLISTSLLLFHWFLARKKDAFAFLNLTLVQITDKTQICYFCSHVLINEEESVHGATSALWGKDSRRLLHGFCFIRKSLDQASYSAELTTQIPV